jgi:undecaprenyl-diphosphatase
MTASPLEHGVLEGAIRGLTEFLPISADGHLALAGLLFELGEKSQALASGLRIGTLVAGVVTLRSRVRAALVGGALGCLQPSRFVTSAGARDALAIAIASVPTAIVGFGLRPSVAGFGDSPLALGLGFLATSLVLLLSRAAKPGRLEHLSVAAAVLVGVAQGLAVLPGLSRSASSVTLLLLLGVKRERAFELSVLIALPALLGIALVDGRPLLMQPALLLPALLGAATACAVGLAALWLLRRAVVGGHFWWFAAWVLPVSLATLALAAAWPRG